MSRRYNPSTSNSDGREYDETPNRLPKYLRGNDSGSYYGNKSRYKDSKYENRQNFGQNRRGSGGSKNGGRPPHLKGREIGMWYAKKQKEKQLEQEPIAEICLTSQRRKDIKQILSTIKETKTFSKSYSFRKKYLNANNINDRYSETVLTNIKKNPDLDRIFRDQFDIKLTSKKYLDFYEERRKLPCFDKRDEILEAIWNNQITLISGETGCGKTTQIPQYILDKFISEGNGSEARIICTQPRRISALAVCDRVADERVEIVGRESVGYQIRLEKNVPRDQGSITFCTTGVVLKQMESDPYLKNVSHIILDEIHERNIVCDFLLTLLKTLLPKRPDLKLILMSATFNSDAFAKYFNNKCAQISVPGFTYPVKEFYLEDVIKSTSHRFEEPFRIKDKNKRKEFADFIEPYVRQIRDFKRYPDYVCQELLKPSSEELDLLLIQKLLENICKEQEDGAILVFLPGFRDISKLCRMIQESHRFPSNCYRIYPLHSKMPTVQQKEIFQTPPKGIRKIIVATNIAETSITINDVVYVIDCGKIKRTDYNAERNLDSLNVEWVSIANADQRRGRAGRVRPGICYHLFSRTRKLIIDKQQKPEILCTRLESVILQMKILQLGQVESFLSKLMDPPSELAIEKSLSTLRVMDALDCDENLTPLGYLLATLPMNPQMGKMLLLGTFFSCLDPILSVAASLDFKDAFQLPMDKEKEAREMKKSLRPNSLSDHLILHEALNRYSEAKRYGEGRQFCREYFLSSNTLELLHDMKGQLANYLREMKFISNSNFKHDKWNANSHNEALVKAVIAAALYPNVAQIQKCLPRYKRIKTTEGERVSIVPGSVNAEETGFTSPLLVYFLKLETNNTINLHDTTSVHPMPLLFFGDNLQIEPDKGKYIIGLASEMPLKFQCSSDTADLIIDLRKKFNELLEWKISNPGVIDWDEESDEIKILRAVARLISSEETRFEFCR